MVSKNILETEEYQVLITLARLYAEKWQFCQATRNEIGANRSKQLAENYFGKAMELLEGRIKEIGERTDDRKNI